MFGSRIPCPYKERLRRSRLPTVERRLEEFIDASQRFRNNMLDVDSLKRCVSALESYIIADIDSVNSVYDGQEWLLVPEARCIKPGKRDMYESDRLCARLADKRAVWPAKTDSRATNCPRTGTTAVLSEDLDCVALFGANTMVKEVHRGFFVYTTIDDVASTFRAATRENMVEKCCLMGTDYNLGIKGVGPVKVQKIDSSETSKPVQNLPIRSVHRLQKNQGVLCCVIACRHEQHVLQWCQNVQQVAHYAVCSKEWPGLQY